MNLRRILIVANQTAGGEHLRDVVRRRMAEGTCHFTLLVPVTPPTGAWTWTDDEATEVARARLERALDEFRKLGADIDGVLEDGGPISAIEALYQQERLETWEPFDEIVLSTLPPGISRWLRQDLPHRVERHFKVPVTHVIGKPEAAEAPSGN